MRARFYSDISAPMSKIDAGCKDCSSGCLSRRNCRNRRLA